ncbi:hypothetical protein AB4Y44_13985 [Paraburkholderia sp. BR10937]|uniref:hypothetical protein n=1 Tax=Paraburkholderia sp. BR10937 TaxID=3236994 RepID=UPI0034D326D9
MGEAYPGSQEGGNNGRGSVNIGIPLEIILGLRTASSASPASSATSTDAPNEPTTAQLLEKGPQFPHDRTPDQFAVAGLLKGGWPFVLDFRPAPGSCTQLKVIVEGQSSVPVTIDPDGSQGRHLIKLEFPAGQPERPAHYVLWSQWPATACAPGGPPGKPSSIDVYGIGAGPGAVGSVAVNQLHFGPAVAHIQTGNVTYTFVTKSPFNHVMADFLRFEHGASTNTVRTVPVVSVPVQPLRPDGHQAGSWDGKDATHRPSIGIHLLQVRAWFTEDNDHSWVGGISDETVTIVEP